MNSKKDFGILELYELIMQRKRERDPNSETYKWLIRGEETIGKKLVEEAVEVVRASYKSDKDEVCSELCDMLYFAFIMAAYHGVHLVDIENKLAHRHKNYFQIDNPEKSIDLSSLYNYCSEQRFSISEMCQKIGLSPEKVDRFIKSNQIIIFSHNFTKHSLSRVERIDVFPQTAKSLKNDLQDKKVKVKLALPPDTAPVFSPRRRVQDWMFPVVVITDVLVLPLFIHILAAYTKDFIDSLSSRRLNPDQSIEVEFYVHDTTAGTERRIKLKGKAKQVHQILVSLSEAPKR